MGIGNSQKQDAEQHGADGITSGATKDLAAEYHAEADAPCRGPERHRTRQQGRIEPADQKPAGVYRPLTQPREGERPDPARQQRHAEQRQEDRQADADAREPVGGHLAPSGRCLQAHLHAQIPDANQDGREGREHELQLQADRCGGCAQVGSAGHRVSL